MYLLAQLGTFDGWVEWVILKLCISCDKTKKKILAAVKRPVIVHN